MAASMRDNPDDWMIERDDLLKRCWALTPENKAARLDPRRTSSADSLIPPRTFLQKITHPHP
jgi:hypothetical protein